MLTGTIQNVEPPDSSDNYGTQYQFITILNPQTNQRSRGRIGSKNPYTRQDVGAQIQVDVQQRQSDKGPYLYFKKQQQGQYQGQQGPQQPRGRANGDEMVRVRSMALSYAKDLVVADKIVQAGLPALVNEFTSFIITGQWFNAPKQDSAQWPDEQPPPPEDSDVPNF